MNAPGPSGEGALVHFGAIGALLAGVFDGPWPVGTVRAHGDFGLGTFNALDGEMVVLDGEVYRIAVDGTAHLASDAEKTPFAAVTFFRPEQHLTWSSGFGSEPLAAFLERTVLSRQRLHAIRVSGHFKRLVSRSMPPQRSPYVPFDEAIASSQKVAIFESIDGTLVGFQLAEYVRGLNVPGFHFHFLDRRRARGGHVLAYEADMVRVDVQILHRFEVQLPEVGPFYDVDFARNR